MTSLVELQRVKFTDNPDASPLVGKPMESPRVTDGYMTMDLDMLGEGWVLVLDEDRLPDGSLETRVELNNGNWQFPGEGTLLPSDPQIRKFVGRISADCTKFNGQIDAVVATLIMTWDL